MKRILTVLLAFLLVATQLPASTDAIYPMGVKATGQQERASTLYSALSAASHAAVTTAGSGTYVTINVGTQVLTVNVIDLGSANVNGTLAAGRFPALTGNVTTTAGSLVTTIGALQVTNSMLAGSIAASKLVGTDIATVGTVTVGTWNADKIAIAYGGTNATSQTSAGVNYFDGTKITSGSNLQFDATNKTLGIGVAASSTVPLSVTGPGTNPSTVILYTNSQTGAFPRITHYRAGDSGAAITGNKALAGNDGYLWDGSAWQYAGHYALTSDAAASFRSELHAYLRDAASSLANVFSVSTDAVQSWKLSSARLTQPTFRAVTGGGWLFAEGGVEAWVPSLLDGLRVGSSGSSMPSTGNLEVTGTSLLTGAITASSTFTGAGMVRGNAGMLATGGTLGANFITRSWAATPQLVISQALGSEGSETAVTAGTTVQLTGQFYGTGFGTGGSLRWLANQTWSGSAHGAYANIWTVPDGSTTQNEVMRWLGNQQVEVLSLGTAALPVLTNNTDPTTGIYFPASTSVGVSTAATLRTTVDSTGLTVNSGSAFVSNGNLKLQTAGNKVFIKTGTNASAGSVTLVAGTATVSTTSVTASSLIFLSNMTSGGTPGTLRVTAITAGTSFVITSNALDTSTVAWILIEPA